MRNITAGSGANSTCFLLIALFAGAMINLPRINILRVFLANLLKRKVFYVL